MTKPDADGIGSRRLLALPAGFILLLALLPWLSDWIESGDWPHTARAFTAEALGTAGTLVLGAWTLAMIRREQRTTLRHPAELERLTLTDPLTGLANRRALERDLPVALSRSDRLGEPLSLLYMDIDRFKQLNDRYGQRAGDETLRTLGAVLRCSSRIGTDTAYRVGGDELVMTLIADRKGGERLGERVVQEFQRRSPRRSTLSLGVMEWDRRSTAADLLDRADNRMYQNKLGGWDAAPPVSRAVQPTTPRGGVPEAP
ncbi:MAG TPA: GGDEF domain-containing protein [Candidatus Eisenbacteria bacterium]|jgi:diguanylate cyclase (GGDEF)-like protein